MTGTSQNGARSGVNANSTSSGDKEDPNGTPADDAMAEWLLGTKEVNRGEWYQGTLENGSRTPGGGCGGQAGRQGRGRETQCDTGPTVGGNTAGKTIRGTGANSQI